MSTSGQLAEGSSVHERLDGRRILLTGVTGFVGQALLERLLSYLPRARLVLLVRPVPGASGRDRVADLLTKPVFDRLRAGLGDGGAQRILDQRIDVIEADLTEAVPALPDDLDVVVHLAGTVSFDPPIDVAFQINLLGTRRLHEALRASGSEPHVVHVSTAYVAGLAKGVVPEAPLQHDVDWRVEADAALAARTATEQTSRGPDLLERLLDDANVAHSRAGPRTVARSAEQRRGAWVHDRLVAQGRQRARSLGWPDVYTFSKALGERCAEDLHGDLPLSIVRPSIIESALRHPRPGWIEGFKMAEPIILGYGRGDIPDFPGVRDAVIDIIPVDLVVNALVAIAAHPPAAGDRLHYHVSSGARNPLTFDELYELVRGYFAREPFVHPREGEIAPPDWRFRGSRRVMRMLEVAEKGVDVADRLVARLPRSDRTRSAARGLDRQRRRLEFVRRYADIYGPYAELEVLYADDRTHALFRSITERDRRDLPFDAAAIDWPHYLQEVHCPSVTANLRQPHVPRQRTDVAANGLPSRADVVAVFDLDGTIVDTNVIESYLWLRLAERGGAWMGEMASLLRSLPRYVAAERRTRESFLRSFYQRYEGADLEGLRRLVDEHVTPVVLGRSAPAALRRVREHRTAGHRTVLLTGAIDLLTRPIAALFDEIVAAELATDERGVCTGNLATLPLVGEARAAWLRRYAHRMGLDLDASYAYADSHSDVPLLEAVGNPVAVNPDVALFRAARSARPRWTVEEWRLVDETPRVLASTAAPRRGHA
ncbi:MAG: HAD-IB family hydrolase [Actinobacteria bacterium]|nr:HAD-IB family hydrolase [Actinomycetota bacterium]